MKDVDTTVAFEAVRVAFRQDKEGYVLTLRIHPSDVTDSIMTDRLGQRYGAALVKINDEPTPAASRELKKLSKHESDYQRALKLFAVCQGSLNVKRELYRMGYKHDGTADEVHTALLRYVSDRIGAPMLSRTDMKALAESCAKYLSQLLHTVAPASGNDTDEF